MKRFIYLVALFIVACQPLQPTSITTQPSPTKMPFLESTPAEFAPTSLPTATSHPTEEAVLKDPSTGPWLAYQVFSNQLVIVNQDGTGRTSSELFCDFESGVDIQENPSNRLAVFARQIFLIQPSDEIASIIYSEWPTCHSAFTKNEKMGLLASIHRSTGADPELRIYEVPGGRIHDQFPLLKCSQGNTACTYGVNWWQIKWSPNGRYLAFPALLEGPSSDLYLYDTESQDLRRLTSGAEDVGQIWWSPDGDRIIMGDILNQDYPMTSSLWMISLNDGEAQLLYTLETPFPQGIVGWLDNDRFIVYDGNSLFDPMDLPVTNLRLVDLKSKEVTPLYKGSFVAAELDAAHETVAFYAYDPEPGPGYQGPGIYLVSASRPGIRFVEGASQPRWNDELELFMTEDPCESDPDGKRGFNYRGDWKCIAQKLPDNLLSPDEHSQIILQDGIWVKFQDQEPFQVSGMIPTQIIWRPDSQGFFFLAGHTLYHVSVPEMNLTLVDNLISNSQIPYQWLE